jgi:cation:H+ antiporter
MLLALLWILILTVSLAVLIKASDYFIESAEIIGLGLKIPRFVIGATIIAFGTSLPELLSSIFAVIQNSSEIVIGNVIGSNVTNIFLILGVTGILFKKFHITHKTVKNDLAILLGTAAFLGFAIIDCVFSLYEGIIFVILMILYIVYVLNIKESNNESLEAPVSIKEDEEIIVANLKTYIILLLSGIFIYIGAYYTVEAVIKLSEILKVGKEIIAITAVALGTSLPELMVCIAAIKKSKTEMVIGNIIGSNVFNTIAIMGVPSLIGTLKIPHDITDIAYPAMAIATLVLTLVIFDKKLSRTEGILLTVYYTIFIAVLIITA